MYFRIPQILRFCFSTLLLAVALLVLFLNNQWSGYSLSLLLSFISYCLYNNSLDRNSIGKLLRLRKGRVDLLCDLLILSFTALVFNLLRTSSNLEFLLNQQGMLYVQNEKGHWESLDTFSGSLSPRLEYQNSNTTIYSLRVKREHQSFLQGIEDLLNPNLVMIFEFSPNNDFSLFADLPDLHSLNAKRAMKQAGASFVINSNFYGSKNDMLGELIIKGKRYGKQSKDASGFFRVIGGKPHVGAKSVMHHLPGTVEYSCQAMPSVIKNGQIFSYISNESGPYKPSWAKKTYRNLVGKKRNGNLVFIASQNGALLSVKEIARLAKLQQVHNASLFDGGAALQYRFENPDYQTSFSSFNNQLYLGQRFEDYMMRHHRMNFSQRSPVYICVKERTQAP